MKREIKVGDIADYTWGEEHGDKAGTATIGYVVKVGKTYADVSWRDSGRVERIHFAHPDGVSFRAP